MPTRRKILFAALWAALAMFPMSALADVRICNRGEVDLKVLRLKTFRFQSLLSWDIEGWLSVPRAECKQISYGDGYTHIVFAVEGPNGRKVVVQYQPEKSTLDDSVKIKEVCVNQEDIEDSGWNSEAKLPAQHLPPCREGFEAVRTSATAMIYGNARMWLNISPKSDDWKDSKPIPKERRRAAAPIKPPDSRLAGPKAPPPPAPAPAAVKIGKAPVETPAAPPQAPPAEEFEGVTIDGEARVRDAIRLDVSPPDALVLLRRPNQQLFIYAGKAGQFAGSARLQLEEGTCLILLRKTGWLDRVLRLTVAADGESTLRVALTK